MNTAESQLWGAVLLQALRDATGWPSGASCDSHADRERQIARDFLIEDKAVFAGICEAAGFDAQVVRAACRRLAAAGWPAIRSYPFMEKAA